MQGELTLRLCSSWMYIAYIPLLFDFFLPLCWWIDKKGEKNFESLYMHVFLVYTHMFCLCKKGRSIWRVYLCLVPHLCIYMLFGLYISLHIFIVYCYAWVKGELPWSLTLIHAYIISWVLSSSKRGEIVGPEAHHSSFNDD